MTFVVVYLFYFIYKKKNTPKSRKRCKMYTQEAKGMWVKCCLNIITFDAKKKKKKISIEIVVVSLVYGWNFFFNNSRWRRIAFLNQIYFGWKAMPRRTRKSDKKKKGVPERNIWHLVLSRFVFCETNTNILWLTRFDRINEHVKPYILFTNFHLTGVGRC